MDLDIKDKVAIVTGGGWGIGGHTAMLLAEEGVKVVIADFHEERGSSMTQKIKDTGGQSLFVKTDVAEFDEVESAVATTLKEFGQIDILVNNAALWEAAYFTTCPREDWDRSIKVCYYGTLNCCKAVIDHMISRKTGCIISLGSDAARVGEPDQPVYSGSKAAVVAFSKALAKEVGRHGIRINVVCPSLTQVERRDENERQMKENDPAAFKAYEERFKKATRFYPLRKFGKPDDVANMIVFLASNLRAGHMTGQTISVNGGYCMM